MALVRDAFTWVDTGAIAYPALYNRIIQLTMPALKLKQLLPEFPILQGRTATFVKESGSRAAAITQVGEGAEVAMDFTNYTYFTVTPYKVGIRERITRETIEDLYIPVIESQLARLARRMAYTIDKDVQTVISNGAANSFSATGVTIAYTGTATSSPGTIGVNDITQAKSVIEGYSLIADSFALHPLNANDLTRLPQFASQDIFGTSVYKEGLGWETGAVGGVMGLDFYITPIVPAGEAYVLSTGKNLSAAYAPLGFFAIKRPLVIDVDFKKEYDSYDVVATTRYAPVITYGESIVKILGLRTS